MCLLSACTTCCLHNLLQGFRTPEEVATFGRMMQGLADIVVGKYDGSLKVGTGGTNRFQGCGSTSVVRFLKM
jgi:hypothetical protein